MLNHPPMPGQTCRMALMWNRQLLLLFLLPLLAMPVQAERVWVVGSYSNKDNALRSMERLSMALGVQVLVVPYAKGGTHRVVIRESAIGKARLGEHGVDAWLANIDIEATVPVQEVVQAPAPVDPDIAAPSSVDSVEEVSVPEIETNESIEAYCERLPSACDSVVLERVLERRAFLEKRKRQLESDCETVKTDDERTICEAWRSGENLDRIADQR